jgi:Lhr-like helicases
MNLPIPADSALNGFHPAVSAWFSNTFATATAAQARAWPLIRQRRSTLIAAPTGSGKTLTAFLAVLDDLVHRGLENPDGLPDETLVVYVSPLKALSNDIRINLQNPLAGITEQLRLMGLPDVPISTAVRTGDTPQKDRSAMRKTAPHILVTTPESLCAARLRLRPENARHHANGDRRRNPRHRRQQTRQSPGPEPGAPASALPATAGADRPVRHAKTHRSGVAFFGWP